jgi:tetratricopeptide (TPR) repeat protein
MKIGLIGIVICISFSSFSQKNKLFNVLSKANTAYNSRDFIKAKNLYVKALSYDSLYVKAYVQLANIAAEQQLFNEAIAYINKALTLESKLESDNVQLAYMYSIRSFCYFNLDKTTESLEDISKAIKLNEENASYFFMRSFMRRMIGDLKGCCLDLKKSADLGNMTATEYLTIYCSK